MAMFELPGPDRILLRSSIFQWIPISFAQLFYSSLQGEHGMEDQVSEIELFLFFWNFQGFININHTSELFCEL